MLSAKEYFEIKKRMVNSDEDATCKIGCSQCPLSKVNQNYGCSCKKLELLYPEKATAIIEKWNRDNPVITNLEKFKEIFGLIPISIHDGHFIMPSNWWDQEYKKQ